jgi:hypothetical protein
MNLVTKSAGQVTCDGWCNDANPVTHIGSKGYVYCSDCAKVRNASDSSERCRRMRTWELGPSRTRLDELQANP